MRYLRDHLTSLLLVFVAVALFLCSELEIGLSGGQQHLAYAGCLVASCAAGWYYDEDEFGGWL